MCYNENRRLECVFNIIVEKLTLRELSSNLIIEEGATYDGSPDIIR